MSSGKIASQTAHAAVSLYIKAKSNPIFFIEIDTWVNTGQAKIVLKGLDENSLIDFETKASDANLISQTVRDAGRTQVEPGALTCLGIFGKISEIDKITSHLNLL
ncbi:unnamed protein product [Brachionus calyciflorus]|uniref:peptidyl-tRNA hydrolase n=1 Tax=Brachionus calyciflorus TaxID=104777 RepID=A0A813PBZ8_9BILA|nr:unnamed protein product [Brachionus calyciflorus]